MIMGHVIQAGTGQITARQAAIEAGIPKEVPAITINKVCLSGLNAIALADQLIRAGELEVVVAGGMESMSQAPYLLPKARDGARMGDAELVDSMMHDGLWSTFTHQHMGESSDEVNRELGIAREEQDAWAARSHARALAAWESGALAEEVVPVEVPQRKGDPAVVARDEGIRPDTTPETLAALRPAFAEDGTITAGNASQISDGGAAVVVMSAERAEREGLTPLAEIVAHGMSAERFAYLHTVPAIALQNALKKAGQGRARPRAARDQRGVRRGVPERGADARRRRGDRERERGSGGARAPDRRDRCTAGPDPGVRDAAPRRRVRRRHPVRRRRPGRRPHLCARPGSGAWAGRSWRTPSRTTCGPRSV